MGNFVALLHEWLSEENLTREQAAKRAGVSRQNFHKWLNGNRTPSVNNILALEKATNGKITLHTFQKARPARKTPQA
jgi:transcriptional regulator with XRE-family HTH domain